jgi:hypothetical protein
LPVNTLLEAEAVLYQTIASLPYPVIHFRAGLSWMTYKTWLLDWEIISAIAGENLLILEAIILKQKQ